MPSGPYQSRLFNLVSRQSRRLSDQVGLRWRQAKTIATWGAQILIYPVYAAFQTTRLVSRQIQQTVQRTLPLLRSAAQRPQPAPEPDLWDAPPDVPAASPEVEPADTPILRSLSALQEFALPIETPVVLIPGAESLPLAGAADLPQLPATGAIARAQTGTLTVVDPTQMTVTSSEHAIQSSAVRGIASQLSTRGLVLVTAQNQVLDVLTPAQQAMLRQRMAWELAGYWRSRRLWALRQRSILLPPSSDNPNLLPPVRWFRRLMAWMQTSPVAIATDLFQESALLTVGLPPEIAALPTDWDPDLSFPEAETAAEVNLKRSWRQWVDQVLLNQATFDLGQPDSLPAVQPIETAIVPAAPTVITVSAPVVSDLTTIDASAPSAISPAPRPAAPGRPVRTRILADDTIAPHPNQRPAGAPKTRSLRSAPGAIVTAPAESEWGDESNLPVPAPTWIETEAKLVGYVKHPLEQVLAWLDAAMLWLEGAIARLWRNLLS